MLNHCKVTKKHKRIALGCCIRALSDVITWYACYDVRHDAMATTCSVSLVYMCVTNINDAVVVIVVAGHIRAEGGSV